MRTSGVLCVAMCIGALVVCGHAYKCYKVDTDLNNLLDPSTPAFWEADTLGHDDSLAGCYATAYNYKDVDNVMRYLVSYGAVAAGGCADALAFEKKAALDSLELPTQTLTTMWETCCMADYCNRKAIPTTMLDPHDTGATGVSAPPPGAQAPPKQGPAPSGGSGDKKLSTGGIVGIAVGIGGAALLAAVAGVVLVMRRRASQKVAAASPV